MSSDSHWEGKNNQSFGGGDWDAYRQGQNERNFNNTYQNESNSSSFNKYPTFENSNSNSGGFSQVEAKGCLYLLLICIAICALVIIIPSAIASITSSAILYIFLNKFLPSMLNPDFGNNLILYNHDKVFYTPPKEQYRKIHVSFWKLFKQIFWHCLLAVFNS